MGREARLNPRSNEGGRPKAFASFHRCIRAVKTFAGDKARFHAWLDTTSAKPEHRARMQRIFDELNPKPTITLHTSIPDVIERNPQPEKQTRIQLVSR